MRLLGFLRRSGWAVAVAMGLTILGPNASASAASIDGLQVQVDRLFPDATTVFDTIGPVPVGPGSEGTLQNIGIDVSGNSIAFSSLFLVNDTAATTYTTPAFNGFVLRDVNGSFDAFTSASVASSLITNGTPVLTFDDDNLFINIAGVRFEGPSTDSLGTFLTVDFTIADTAVIPLPAGAVLLLTGLGGLAVMRRRRRTT
ncbi:MAG: VPLPA-CTERM sorting domain-containing protein [Pseudomonadota bacterium]